MVAERRSLSLVLAAVALLATQATTHAQDPMQPMEPMDGTEPAAGEGPQRIEELPPMVPQRVYILAVAMDPSLEAVAARVGAAARGALREVEGAQWEAADQRFLGYDDQSLARLRVGRTRLTEGRQAYLNLELQTAIDLLGQAVDDFDAAAAAMEDPADLGDALLFLGASQTFQGENRAARETFQRLHIQFPHVQPDPNVFPPDVVDRYESARPRGGEGEIVIESEPPGAIAYVDFLARGRTPITVGGFNRGSHVVRVTRPGATPFVQEVDVRPGSSEGVNAFLMDVEGNEGLADLAGAIGGETPESLPADSPVTELATMLELDRVGVVRVSLGEDDSTVFLEMSIFDLADGRRLLRGQGPAPVAVGDLEPAVKTLVEGALQVALRPQQVVVEPPPPPPPPPPPEEEPEGDPIWGKWWFWAAVGGTAAAALIIGLAVGLSGGSSLSNDPSGQVLFEF